MRRAALRIAAVMAMAAGLAVAAEADNSDDYPVDPKASSVGFTISAKMLVTLKRDGTFHDFAGSVNYDPADPAATRVDLTVYTASIDIKNPEHDALLRSEEFFDVGHHPTMHFVSTAVQPRGDGRLDVIGDLTIRGVTRHMVVPMTIVNRGAGAAAFETRFQIDRTDFGLNGGGPKSKGFKVSIGRNVDIHLAIAAAKTAFAPKQ